VHAFEIVSAMVALAHTLGFHVTAEGVERLEQYQMLRELGVDYIQGFFVSAAVAFDEAVAMLKNQESDRRGGERRAPVDPRMSPHLGLVIEENRQETRRAEGVLRDERIS
jgi:predicted signal transduction protein with EAL and GGDEF domain